MRNHIGWKEVFDDGIRYEVRVIVAAKQVEWKRQSHAFEPWLTFEPSPDHWELLLEKVNAAYRRRHAPYKDVQLVERLAKAAIANAPKPPPQAPPH